MQEPPIIISVGGSLIVPNSGINTDFLINNKISIALRGLFENGDIPTAVNSLKEMRFKVINTKSWNEAEFTAGGINVNEIKPGTLESKLRKGIYFAGEVLDVNGKRGGYNLGWAWASGFVAGQTLN